MKKFIVLILALNMYLGVSAQFTPGDTLKYRISLKDKAATDYSLQKPEKYLSKKSIERRKKQGLPIDSTDLPVCVGLDNQSLLISLRDILFFRMC